MPALPVDGKQLGVARNAQPGKNKYRHAPGQQRLELNVAHRDWPIGKNTSGTISMRQTGCVRGRSACAPSQIR